MALLLHSHGSHLRSHFSTPPAFGAATRATFSVVPSTGSAATRLTPVAGQGGGW